MKILLIVFGVALLAAGCNNGSNADQYGVNDSIPSVTEPEEVSATTDANPRGEPAVPIDQAKERITKKPFGLYVEPGKSPVDPEVFRGYHAAVDYEILPGEELAVVTIRAICDGKLLQKRTATGYGGVIVQDCTINDQAVTVVYGHLQLSSIVKQVGEFFARGEDIGVLGKAFSSETGNERKHLHLGIHKGSSVDIRGYVQNQSELSGWIDFESL